MTSTRSLLASSMTRTVQIDDVRAVQFFRQNWTVPYRFSTVLSMTLSIKTHVGLTDEIALYPRDRRYAVPRRFTSTVRDDDLGVEVEVDTEVDDRGDPHCRRLEIRALGDEAVTWETLRRVPLGRWLRHLMTQAAWKVTGPTTMQTGMSRDERVGFYEQYAKGGRRPRQGSPLTDEHLRRVADLYRAALERGDAPTQTIAHEMHAARSTAARWVAMARERGLLGPAKRGQAGEASTDIDTRKDR